MCEVCVIPALSTGVGSSAQTAVLRTLWTGTSKVTGAVMVVTVRALGLACAVRRQVHSLRTFQTHVPATAFGTGTVAVPADASSVLGTFMKESIWAHSRHQANAGSCYTPCTRWQTRTCDSSSRRVDKFCLLDRCLTQRSCLDTRTHNFCRVSDICCPCTRYTQTHLYRCDSESGISHRCFQHLRCLTCSRTPGSPIRTSSRESGSVRFGILCRYEHLHTGCSFEHISDMFFQTLLHRACKIQEGISPHTFH